MNSAIDLLAKAFNLSKPDNGASSAWAASPWRALCECLVLAVLALAFGEIHVFGGVLSLFAWIGLVPLYLIARGGSVVRAAGRGFVWGCFWSLSAFWWLREIEPFIPFIMAAVLGFFPMCWAMAIPSLERCLLLPKDVRLKGYEAVSSFRSARKGRELLLALSLASLWCFTEWVRSWIATGLPWNFLGQTQWRFIDLIQICEWTGVYGLSFVVILVNIALAMLLAPWTRGRLAAPALALAVFAGALSAGFCAKRSAEKLVFDKTLSAAVVQCDISQRRKATLQQAEEALDVCLSLSEGALAGSVKDGSKLDLVLWPETAVPYPLLESASSFSISYRYRLFDVIRAYKKPFLVGSLDYGDVPGPTGYRPAYNAALLVDTTPQVVDFYRKVHLVPFGEYVPYGDKFPGLNKMIGMGRNLSEGVCFNPMEVAPGIYGGMSVCYEDVFSDIARAHARNGANLLMVITNDAWYPKSSEPYQHFANAVLRSVETRLPMLRCGNSSYSALIDPLGRVVDSVAKKPDGSPDPAKQLRAFAIMKPQIQARPALTFHTLYGDVFILLCVFIAGAGSFIAAFEWRDFKLALLGSFEGKPPLA